MRKFVIHSNNNNNNSNRRKGWHTTPENEGKIATGI